MRWFAGLALFASFCFVAMGQETDEEQAEIKYAESLLHKGGIKTDGGSLLKFFHTRTPSLTKQRELAELVETLGDNSFRKRARATLELDQAGQQALPFLQKGLHAEDEEIVRRSELCLEKVLVTEETEAPRIVAAARLLAHRKPDGAAKALIDFLPFIHDKSVIDQIQDMLPGVVVEKGKPAPEAVQALKDSFAVRRAVAGAALARVGEHEEVLKLLRDPDLDVRLLVARSLAQSKEAKAVPVLIALLEQLPPEKAWQAEDLLYQLAADTAPNVSLGANVPAAKVRKTWEKWWKDHQGQAKTLLAKLSQLPGQLGYTLVAQMTRGGRGTSGRVMEINKRGQVRWKFGGVRYPVDAQVVGHNRVLVVEYLNRRVTERDFKGNIHWTYSISLPLSCQRLPNGNTFVVSRRLLVELDRNGKQVYAHRTPQTVYAAAKLRNGQIVMISNSNRTCIRINAQGKKIKEFGAGPVYTMGGSIDALPNGHILVPEYSHNRVVEYTPDGKVFWQAPVRFPTTVQRLANGNTLVVSMTEQRILEINRNRRVVWSYRADGRPWCARRR